jgi:hypothetical protein
MRTGNMPQSIRVFRFILVLTILALIVVPLGILMGVALGNEPEAVIESYGPYEYIAVYQGADKPAEVWNVVVEGDISHCEDGCTSLDGWDHLAEVTAGDVKMPDDVVMQADDLVEWIEYKGRPSNWTTGNNYAVPGTPHAEGQRKMLSMFKQVGGAEVKLMLTTAVEFLSRMAKAGLKVLGPLMALVPDAQSANEDAEIGTQLEKVNAIIEATCPQPIISKVKEMIEYNLGTMTIYAERGHQNESTGEYGGSGHSPSYVVLSENTNEIVANMRRDGIAEQTGWPEWKVHWWAMEHPGC